MQRVLATIVVVCVTLANTALAQPRSLRLEGYPCAPMRWESEHGQPRVALSTPVRLNGVPYWFQFDTGAWANILYGNEADRRGWTVLHGRSLHSQSFEAGGTALQWAGALLLVQRDMPGGEPAGTLGLSSLMGKLTVIDYRAMRLCILPRTADVAVARRATWTPMELRGGPHVTIQIGGQSYSDMLFDTGSSRFALLVGLPLWTRLTGYDAPSDAPVAAQGTAWGHPKTWRGAPSRETITIAGVVSHGANVFIDETDPTAINRLHADGIFGNALLWDHVVLLDFRDDVPDDEWASVGAGAQRRQPRFGVAN